jgi:hypothetical protein
MECDREVVGKLPRGQGGPDVAKRPGGHWQDAMAHA